jgi:mannose-6-phosphate isomerase-like protein (cupin superfamily)
MEVHSAVPSVTVTEHLTVQPLADLAGARKLRANVWTLAPGDWSWGRHVHREQEELYLVLEGRLRVEAGGETLEIGAREALVVPAGLPHQLWNAGEEDVTYLAAAAPAVQGDSAPA